jgi:hypothetical protein
MKRIVSFFTQGRAFYRLFIATAALMLLGDIAAFAQQNYEFSLRHRRRADQIWVEVWCRALTATPAPLGESTFRVTYDQTKLTLADYTLAANNPNVTDTIRFDIGNLASSAEASAVVTLNSPYDVANNTDYQSMIVGTSTPGVAELQVRRALNPGTGTAPSNLRRGTFIGKLVFTITNPLTLADADTSGISWSTNPQSSVIYNYSDVLINNTNISYVNPGTYRIRGITLLNPNGPNEVVDRNSTSFTTNVAGYPIYFERSGLATDHSALTGAGQYGSTSIAYALDYRTTNGGVFTTIASIDETGATGSSGTNDDLTAGALPGGLTSQIGTALAFGTPASWRSAVRVIWTSNNNYTTRSEQAQLRIRYRPALGGAITTIGDTSDAGFTLGRLFFAQMNGQNQYFKTTSNYLNATQLTVEAWVNLNADKGVGANPGILASALGGGLEEGAWMLYLKDGKYPAFRAREILGRSNGYVANLVSDRAMSIADSATPLGNAHSQNWHHIAATVSDNTVTLYVDGEIVERSVNTAATNIRMLLTNHPIWMGVNPNNSAVPSANDHFPGGIKGARVWRIALSQTELRQRVAGIPAPATFTTPTDIRRGLEVYYDLEGRTLDLANDATFQNGTQGLTYFANNISSTSIRYRPDQSHIRLTSPAGGEGISNAPAQDYTLRWVGYGLGQLTGDGTPDASNDLAIEYSQDGTNNWTIAKNAGGSLLANNLGYPSTTVEGAAVDIEAGTATWRPVNNNATNNGTGFTGTAINLADQSANTGFNPYSNRYYVRVRGVNGFGQQNIISMSDSVIIAPFFSLRNTANSYLMIPRGAEMNITSPRALFEAWIRPYQFPTAGNTYPILVKVDTNNTLHYALRLMPSGQIQFAMRDKNGQVRTALSDTNKPLVRPRSIADDSTWTHVAAYVDRTSNQSKIYFFIDGIIQSTAAITDQLGTNVTVDSVNTFPTYIGYEPGAGSFLGELKEIRYWNGAPGGAVNLTAATQAIQSNIVERAGDGGFPNTNLVVAFSFNGGSFINGNAGTLYSFAFPQTTISTPSTILARWYGSTQPRYVAALPFLKIVEPEFNQRIANTVTNQKIRWVGFDYTAAGFNTGVNAGASPSLEFSLLGGGGNVVQPFQFIGSDFFAVAYTDALTLTAGAGYVSTANSRRYAADLNFALGDPDLNNDNTFTDQGPLAAVLTNARFRLNTTYPINGATSALQGVSSVFTITPASNFTVRVLLQGYHQGIEAASATPAPNTASAFRVLGSSFDNGGLKIKLYSDNGGVPGVLVDSAESSSGYHPNAFTASAINTNLRTNTADGPVFANVPFVFTSVPNGSYFVVVQHRNHLPLMSRLPATFAFNGDSYSTFQIESGWDFTNWLGSTNPVTSVANPNSAGVNAHSDLFPAYGVFSNSLTDPNYGVTALAYDEGRDGLSGTTANYVSSMIAGDLNRDMFIDATDRVIVRSEAGSVTNLRGDVDGSGAVDAADRTIVDRNNGRSSSLRTILPTLNAAQSGPAPFAVNPALGDAQTEEQKLYAMMVDAENAPASKATPARKGESALGAQAVKYTVSAEPKLSGNQVTVDFYINNQGADFALANCTFTVKFNPDVLGYMGVDGASKTIFSGADKGYQGLASAPTVNAPANHPLRSLELFYDAFARKNGTNVPSAKTYVGTLRFAVKRSDRAIAFNWDNVKVIATNGTEVTSGGTFETIKPILTYTASMTVPNGGERFRPSRALNVQWKTAATAPVHVEFSTDNGATWVRITSSPIVASKQAAQWQMPDINSKNCLVRIVDAESGFEVDRSKSTFTIAPVSAAITRPSTNDAIYYYGASDAIKWAQDGLSNVRFEFKDMSKPSGNWAPVTTQRNANDGTAQWTIPAINTKRGVVRMVDIETGEEIARSGEFRMLAGNVNFTTPKTGDIIAANSNVRVGWGIRYNVQNVDLQFSADGGSNWTTFATNIAANSLSAAWKAPAEATEYGTIRAIFPNEPELEYSRTPLFRIGNATGINENNGGVTGSATATVQPNPAQDRFTLSFNLPFEQKTDITIVNSLGMDIMKVAQNALYSAGENRIEIGTSAMPNGTYFVRITAENGSMISIPVVIVR